MLETERPSLNAFHPIVREWFVGKFGRPTEVQEKAWSAIAKGDHSLITAATGSGKTLAAFLWAINQLASGEWELGQTRVIYVSPLKALNNDIQRNLLEPLSELRECFDRADEAWPEIRVSVRSGDTEQSDRRKMLRHPPEILIITPESLNLLLTSRDGQRALLGVKSLILDEIHSVVDSKRGVYLMTAVERLALLTGEFQRIALSATVRPMEAVAAFVGGFEFSGELFQSPLVVRKVMLIESTVKKKYAIRTRLPEEASEDISDDDFWQPIIRELKQIIAANQSTLIFVNSRRFCEKITYKINYEEPSPIAYSHHGSLSKDIRFAVEQRLKRGELKAIVATNSLELGIDIGTLDQVVMIQCPGAVSSAIQKAGRAGHQVGAVSKATLFPSHSRDFMEAAVLSKAIRDRNIEPVHPVEAPLDVLAQLVVSMVGVESKEIDEIYTTLRASYPYRNLARETFDLVLDMLAGRYATSRLRELKPRVSINRSENTVTIRKGALMAYYFNGGVIPDRGYFHLRMEGTGARIGELDEEFVWERVIGDAFTLGAQTWRIERITYNDVFVSPGDKGGSLPPFWKADEFNRDFHYSTLIGEFLEWADDKVEEKDFEETLKRSFDFEETTARALAGFLRNQRTATSRSLPHRHHLVAELIDAGPTGAPGQQLVLHTHWGGMVNRPLALAIDGAWEEAFGHRTEVYVNNDCVVLMVSEGIGIEEVLRLVDSGNVESMLRKRLENSGFFGARFREAAGTALLVTRQRAGQRLPLWLSRLRSKKLLESVRNYGDFPIMLEAWRTCLLDEFDMESLKRVLAELEQGRIDVSITNTAVASPFASSVAWRQINDQYMYDNDDPLSSEDSKTRQDLVRLATFDEALRPSVSRKIVHEFELKRQRLAEGYAPTDELELKEWLRDRIAIPEGEWDELIKAGRSVLVPPEDRGRSSLPILKKRGFVFLEEESKRFDSLFAAEPDADLFIEWLSYYGPVSVERILSLFRLDQAALTALVDSLVDEQRVVAGKLVPESDEPRVCDAENFESLLRMQRARNRPSFDPLPLKDLVRFLAERQGIIGSLEGKDGASQVVEQLTAYVERAALWEEDLLPARLSHYRTSDLDGSMVEDFVEWRGVGSERVAFGFGEDLEVLHQREASELGADERKLMELMATNSGGKFAYHTLLNEADLTTATLEEKLWSLVWKGKVANDSYAAIRRGISAGFSISESIVEQNQKRQAAAPARTRFGRRTRLLSAAKTVVYPGNWYTVKEIEKPDDLIEELEVQKDKARILFDRYGVLFRELLQREASGFQWKDVFKSLRLMELSGEILAGVFFDGISGLQFASQDAFRKLRKGFAGKPVYWMNATDPASLCGIGLEGLRGVLPKRLGSTRLVYRGNDLVAEVQKNGKCLLFHVDPEDEDIPRIIEVLRHMLTRSFNAIGTIHLETINGEDARISPYLESLDACLRLHKDHKRVVIEGVK